MTATFIGLAPLPFSRINTNLRQFSRHKRLSGLNVTTKSCLQSGIGKDVSTEVTALSSSFSSRSVAQQTVIVPGKFDSLHIGHRYLAKLASEHGMPTLMSFSGMSNTLGWAPRAPVVAAVERDGILRTWSSSFGVTVTWETLAFGDIRDMTPEQFVNFLINRFNASAIVCGSDWRFGKQRQGDIHTLKQLAKDKNLNVIIADPVLYQDEIVSSTRVRKALNDGNVELVSQLLGRMHRVVGYTIDVNGPYVVCGGFINMLPKNNSYNVIARVIGRAEPLHTQLTVDQDEGGEPLIRLLDAQHVYCADCEIYIDFVSEVSDVEQ